MKSSLVAKNSEIKTSQDEFKKNCMTNKRLCFKNNAYYSEILRNAETLTLVKSVLCFCTKL